LSTSYSRRAYPRVDSIDDESCRPDFTLLCYPGFSRQSLAPNVTAGHPPTFIMQAEDDPFNASNALVYYMRLKAMGAPPSELHIYQNGGHAYGRCGVVDAAGRHAALVASDDPTGPPVKPAWLPWSEVCTWPARAERFIKGLAP